MTIKSTKAQLEEFKESFIWSDIKDELTQLDRLAQLEYDIVGEPHKNDSGSLVIPNSSETLIHLGDIKGRRKAVKYFLDIIDVLIDAVTQQQEDKKASKQK